MKTKSFYNKPTVKIVKIDHVHLLDDSIEPYGPGGSGHEEEGGNEQGGSEVPGT